MISGFNISKQYRVNDVNSIPLYFGLNFLEQAKVNNIFTCVFVTNNLSFAPNSVAVGFMETKIVIIVNKEDFKFFDYAFVSNIKQEELEV